jgi:DNA-binding MarR family transcriptional regulator
MCAAREQRTSTAAGPCTDALSALVQALRTIQVSQGDRPWLVLDLTMAQLKALILLVQSGGLRSRDLADGLGIAPSAATPLVDRLVHQKLARRENDAEDRRIIWIRPTAKAVAQHEKLMQTNRSVLQEVLEELPAGERPKVYESVQLLLKSAQRVLARRGAAARQG